MISLSYLYRVGKSTVPKIIVETTEVFWQTLQSRVLPPPTVQTWAKIAEDFEVNGIFQIVSERLTENMLLYNVLKIWDLLFIIIKARTVLF